MRLLTIGIISVILFFPLYFLLHPILGANWGAGVSAFLMYIGFPIMFLKVWKDEWSGPIVKFLNYIIAICVLGCSIYFFYIEFMRDGEGLNAFKFFGVYGTASIYYIIWGRFHINLKGKKT
jgi:hypothetical protein